MSYILFVFICLGIVGTISCSHLFTMDAATTITTSCRHLLATARGNWMFALTLKERLFPEEVSNDPPLEGKYVVVFIHGRNGHPSNWNITINNIIEINDTFMHDYYLRAVYLGPTHNTTFDDDAAVLHEYLKKYHQCHIILVGVSKGGVVAMNYKVKYNQNITVITISSPLKGTKIASLFPITSIVGSTLGYNNAIVTDIKHGITNYSNVYHIVPLWDHVIIPTSSAYYDETPKDNVYFHNDSYYSHASIQYDMKVAHQLIKFIKHNSR